MSEKKSRKTSKLIKDCQKEIREACEILERESERDFGCLNRKNHYMDQCDCEDSEQKCKCKCKEESESVSWKYKKYGQSKKRYDEDYCLPTPHYYPRPEPEPCHPVKPVKPEPCHPAVVCPAPDCDDEPLDGKITCVACVLPVVNPKPTSNNCRGNAVCVKNICFLSPIKWLGLPAASTTLTIANGTSGNYRWITDPALNYDTYTTFTDNNIFNIEVDSDRCNFNFTINYYYSVAGSSQVFTVSPSSETYPLSLNETAHYTIPGPASTTISLFDVFFTEVDNQYYNPITSSYDTFGKIKQLQVTVHYVNGSNIPTSSTIIINQSIAKSKVVVDFNKKVGINNVRFKVSSANCIRNVAGTIDAGRSGVTSGGHQLLTIA